MADGSQKITTTDHTNGIVEHKTTNLDGSYTVETVANSNRTIEKFNKQGRKLSSITTDVESQLVDTNKPDATPIETKPPQANTKPKRKSFRERVRNFFGINDTPATTQNSNKPVSNNSDSPQVTDKKPEKVNAGPDSYRAKFARNQNAITNVDKGIQASDVTVNANYTGYTSLAGKSKGVNTDVYNMLKKESLIEPLGRNVDIYSVYDPGKNITSFGLSGTSDAFGRPGLFSITVEGQVSESDVVKIVKHLNEQGLFPDKFNTKDIPLQELLRRAALIQEEVAKFFRNL